MIIAGGSDAETRVDHDHDDAGNRPGPSLLDTAPLALVSRLALVDTDRGAAGPYGPK
ncbi:MAG: hypothetical protein AAGE05_11695 [Pseudomonadota bacterium]